MKYIGRLECNSTLYSKEKKGRGRRKDYILYLKIPVSVLQHWMGSIMVEGDVKKYISASLQM